MTATQEIRCVPRHANVETNSDGVLNPQGIRFGSSEIYSITEAHPFNETIETTLCIGRSRKGIDTDESVFLFVVMRDGHRFDRGLERSLRDAIPLGAERSTRTTVCGARQRDTADGEWEKGRDTC